MSEGDVGMPWVKSLSWLQGEEPFGIMSGHIHILFRRMANWLPALAGMLSVADVAAQLSLPEDGLLPSGVQAIVKKHGLPLERLGLVVVKAMDGEPVAVVNADQAFNLASVAKIFTTIAGYGILGSRHRWKTGIHYDGKVNGGVLKGNLYLKGGGDPFLTRERFSAMLLLLREKGIHSIEGDVVIDNSLFSVSPHDPNAFDGAGLKPYNAGPDAMLVNYKTFEVIFSPAVDKGIVSLHLSPLSENIRIVDKVRLSGGRCRNWRWRIRERYRLDRNPAEMELSGKYPKSCGRQSFHVSVLDNFAYVSGVFAAYWRLSGGVHKGGFRTGETPQGARLAVEHESAPFPEIIDGINKFSNNVMARQLFLALGEGVPKSLESSRKALGSWLALNGVNVDGLFIDNGAGLSRQMRASPRQVAETLQIAWKGRWRHEVFASFPVIGYDGTLRKRLRKSSVSGYGRLKTGSLRSVRAIAGILHHPTQGDMLFVAVVNWSKSGGASKMFDDLIEWVYDEMESNGEG